MTIQDISESNTEEIKDVCQCGRSKDKIHCPYCGRAKLYGYKNTIEKRHPVKGILTKDIREYRCQSCGRQFDDLQWQFDCHAPLAAVVVRKENKEMTAKQWRDLAMSGKKFDGNMKRQFKKAMAGYEYDDWMARMSVMDRKRLEMELAVKKIEHSKPKPVVIKDKPLTPFEAHQLNCSKFNADQQCDVCDNLMKVEMGLIKGPDIKEESSVKIQDGRPVFRIKGLGD
jgi:DNA-directed RNA polymerase subunit RPC12/RpoP